MFDWPTTAAAIIHKPQSVEWWSPAWCLLQRLWFKMQRCHQNVQKYGFPTHLWCLIKIKAYHVEGLFQGKLGIRVTSMEKKDIKWSTLLASVSLLMLVLPVNTGSDSYRVCFHVCFQQAGFVEIKFLMSWSPLTAGCGLSSAAAATGWAKASLPFMKVAPLP